MSAQVGWALLPKVTAPVEGRAALAVYACHSSRSLGRRYDEAAAPTRSPFQRDRDRIVHSTAFRRLVYKTQVFLNHEGDLGHTPFGHAGQDALNDCLKKHQPNSAGFEHNLQSLRVVDSLEERYPAYDGLNLTFETREGILKHCSQRNALHIEAREPGGVARRFTAQTNYPEKWLQPGLEAQLANLADEIAYNAHDIDDGVRSGLLTLEQLQDVELFADFLRETLQQHPMLTGRRLLFETIRRMLSAQVYNVMEASRAALAAAAPQCLEEVRLHRALIRFTPDMADKSARLKRFLFHNLYRHPQVLATTQAAQQVVRELFSVYMDDSSHLPQAYVDRLDGTATSHALGVRRDRVVADYIAGMTDRFAAKEHERLKGRAAFT